MKIQGYYGNLEQYAVDIQENSVQVKPKWSIVYE